MKEIIVKSIPLYNGRVINLERKLMRLKDNSLVLWECVSHPKGVCILPILNNKVIFVKQFRIGALDDILELPAGLVDKDEDSLTAAKRELAEEINYTTNDLEFLGSFYASPGCTDELVDLYIATNLTKQVLPKDEDEFIQVYAYSFESIKKMLYTNEIKDMKTCLALSMYFNKHNI